MVLIETTDPRRGRPGYKTYRCDQCRALQVIPFGGLALEKPVGKCGKCKDGVRS